MFKRNGKIGRRDLFKTSAGIMGGALLSREAAAEQAAQRNVNTNSSPSALKITDLRVATVVKPGPSPCTIIRLDTNQGVYGLGEVRDGASATYALFLKSRLLDENPLNITYLFQKIKQFGGPRAAGGRRGGRRRGPLGHRRQSVRRAHLPDAGRQVPRQASASMPTPTESRRPQGLRPAHEGAQGRDGPHLAEDGPGHRPGRRDSRHGDRALRR